MCTDAYREALTRDLSSTAASAPMPSQHPTADAGREAENAPAVNGTVYVTHYVGDNVSVIPGSLL